MRHHRTHNTSTSFHAHVNVSDLILGLAREATSPAPSHCHHGCQHGCNHTTVVHHHHRRPPRARPCAPPPCAAPVAVHCPSAAPTTPTGAYIRIVRASYGAGSTWLDVTYQLQGLVMGQGGLTLRAFGSRQSMNALLGDPCHGVRKRLEFTYEVVGQPKSITLSEDRKLNLSMDELHRQSGGCHGGAPHEAGHFDLVVLSSSYGIGERRYDVSTVLGGMVAHQGGKSVNAFGYFFTPNGCMNQAFGDPAPGSDKDLRVSYMWRTPVMSCSAGEDQEVCLSYVALRPLL